MRKTLLALSLMLFGAAALAEVSVKDSWVRGTTPAQKATGAFMEITSTDNAALLSAASPAAEVVEVHTMKMEDGVMKMRQIERVELPAGKAVLFAPGGNHIMMMGLKQQLKKGDVVPLTLKIEGQDKQVRTLEIKAEVRDLTAPAMPGHEDKHHH
ncbi:MAG: copper chaperone PCu(A)C [Zoogloeaceae bacterium]|jgi:copper(I)-binding protein|nr:copper chaperone PCu(A)C [Zoogloeaceae bacterium]